MGDVLARVEVQRWRFTVDEHHRMAETGILTADDRVELIEGEIVQMSPTGHHHIACVLALNELLTRARGGRALLSPQNPVRLPRDSEPQPDVVLLRPPLSQYWARLPQPADVLLLVEVTDTSYRYDHDVKLPLYARAGIAEAWIIDLPRVVVEVYREPGAGGYASRRRVERGGRVAPAAFPDVVLAIDKTLPPA